MSAVSFLYFSLEAVKAMHITILQTFSTGNRTLKREMYHYFTKNLRVIRKPEESVEESQMDSTTIRISLYILTYLLHVSEISMPFLLYLALLIRSTSHIALSFK